MKRKINRDLCVFQVLVALAIFLTAVDMGVLLKHFKRMRKKNNILLPPKKSDAKGKK